MLNRSSGVNPKTLTLVHIWIAETTVQHMPSVQSRRQHWCCPMWRTSRAKKMTSSPRGAVSCTKCMPSFSYNWCPTSWSWAMYCNAKHGSHSHASRTHSCKLFVGVGNFPLNNRIQGWMLMWMCLPYCRISQRQLKSAETLDGRWCSGIYSQAPVSAVVNICRRWALF